jgi:hypothetical protein
MSRVIYNSVLIEKSNFAEFVNFLEIVIKPQINYGTVFYPYKQCCGSGFGAFLTIGSGSGIVIFLSSW